MWYLSWSNYVRTMDLGAFQPKKPASLSLHTAKHGCTILYSMIVCVAMWPPCRHAPQSLGADIP